MSTASSRVSRVLSRRITPTTRPQTRSFGLAATANARSSSSSSSDPASASRLQTKRLRLDFYLHHCHPRHHFHASRTAAAMSAAETDAQASAAAQELQVTPDSLGRTLREKLGATHCAIEDMSGGCGQAFEAIIVSSQFEKKNSLARHRLVNGALKQEIAAIHAWTSKCYTPEEWEKKNAS